MPDLRGFGESDKHAVDPADGYSVTAQARSVIGLVDELELAPVVLAGYDIGSRIAQAVARAAPDRVRALVLAPPLPGAGDRVLTPDAQREFWYQPFHRLGLADELIDGRPDAVRAYLRHIWSHWSGPAFELSEADLDRLVAQYAEPGAFGASIAWYRAGSGMVATSLAEVPPPRRSASRSPRASSGLSMTRSSRPRGLTGSTSGSPTSPSPRCRAPVTSRRSRRRRHTPRRSEA